MQTIGLLFKVLWSPGETMFLLSKNPRVLAPLLFLCLFSFGTGMVMVTHLDMAELTIRAIERTPRGATFPEQQKENMRQTMKSPVVKGITFVSTAVGPLILIGLVTLVYFALFTIVGREGSFKSFFSITAFALVPLIFRQVAAAVAVLVIPPSALMLDELGSVGPAVFLDRDAVSPVLFTAVSSIDLITIWTLILLTIGYGYVTRKSLSKMTRAACVVGVFLVYAVFRLGYSAVMGI
jgi:Yip1 domain